MKVSVILPTYNERENIKKLIGAILKAVKQPLEIIVVDDDSPDGTWEIVQGMSNKNKRIKLLRRTGERGLAASIADGISMSKGGILVWMDCDFSHPPALIPKLIEGLENYDISVASRYAMGGKDERKFFRALMSRVINLFANILLGFYVKDYTSGFIAIKRRVLGKAMFSRDGYGEYFIELLYRSHKNGFKINEVPYVFKERESGKSKTSMHAYSIFLHVIRYLTKVLKLKLNN